MNQALHGRRASINEERIPVERDLWFQPGPIDEVLRRERPLRLNHILSANNQ